MTFNPCVTPILLILFISDLIRHTFALNSQKLMAFKKQWFWFESWFSLACSSLMRVLDIVFLAKNGMIRD